MPTGEELLEAANTFYPIAGEYVDGRVVGDRTANEESIGASLYDWEELPGLREVPMGLFEIKSLRDLFYSADDFELTKELAAQIENSSIISPLIVVVDLGGVEHPYVLEGAHRLGALHLLGAKSFPALVVVDMEETREAPGTVGQASSSFASMDNTPIIEEVPRRDVEELLRESFLEEGHIGDELSSADIEELLDRRWFLREVPVSLIVDIGRKEEILEWLENAEEKYGDAPQYSDADPLIIGPSWAAPMLARRGNYVVLDGWHRLGNALERGLSTVRAIVGEGDQDYTVGQLPVDEEDPFDEEPDEAPKYEEDLMLLAQLGYQDAKYLSDEPSGRVYQVGIDRVVKLTRDEREMHCAELLQNLQEEYGRAPYHEHLPIIYKARRLGFTEGIIEKEAAPYPVSVMGAVNQAVKALKAAGITVELGADDLLENWGITQDGRVVLRNLKCGQIPYFGADINDVKEDATEGDFDNIARLKILRQFENEEIAQEGRIPISFSHGIEEWPWLLLEGTSGDIKGGRIVLVDPSNPSGGLAWVEEEGEPKIVAFWVKPELRQRGALRALIEVYREHVFPYVVIARPFSKEGYRAAIALADEIEGELAFSMQPSSTELLSEIEQEELMWESGYMAGLMKRPADQGNMVFALARAPDGRLVAWADLELAPADESMRYNEEFRDRTPYDVGIWVTEKFRKAGVAKRLLSMLLKIGGEEGIYIGYHEWVCGILDKLGALYICHENDEKHVRDPYGILKP